MTEEDLERTLQGVKKIWKNPRGIHLAGGEATLNFDLLLHGVTYATKLGMPIEYVETNAAWCTDRKKAEEYLKRLKEAGLHCLLISCSPFHAGAVPLKRTHLAVDAAIEVFGIYGVIIYMPHCMREIAAFDTEKPVPIQRYIDAYGPERTGTMLWQGYGLIPGGRSGFELGCLTKRVPAKTFQGLNCVGEIMLSRHAHFDLYGNYIPSFCGGLSLGQTNDLASFVKEYDINDTPIIKRLVEGGPFALAEWASEEYDFKEDVEGYVGKCHLCVDVRRHIVERTKEFNELSPIDFYKYLRSPHRRLIQN